MADTIREIREAEKTKAVNRVRELIDKIEQLDRLPDLWEKTLLLEAIDAINRGLYDLAYTKAKNAGAEPKDRSQEANLGVDFDNKHCDVSSLRYELEKVAVVPVKLERVLGPSSMA